MPTFVLHEGRLVERRELPRLGERAVSGLAAPAVQTFQTYNSPIDEAPISSHRQRDKDLHNSGSYDPRDTPTSFRKARDARTKRHPKSS